MKINTGHTLFDMELNIFFDLFHHTKETRAQVNKWDLIKLKSFCTAKETIDKRQHTLFPLICRI